LAQPLRGLGELLVRERLITPEQLNECIQANLEKKEPLTQALVSQGIVDEQTLIQFFSRHYKLPIMDLSNFTPDPIALKLFNSQMLAKHQFLPVGKRGDTLVIAVSDPTNIQVLDDIRFQVRMRIEQVLALPSVLRVLVDS